MKYSLDALLHIAFDFAFPKPNDRPPIGYGRLIEQFIVRYGPRKRVPIVTVSLDDDTSAYENEIWLPSAIHRFMHLKGQSTSDKGITQRLFDGCHFLREVLAHARCSDLTPRFLAELSPSASFIQLCLAFSRVQARTRFQSGNSSLPIFRIAPPSKVEAALPGAKSPSAFRKLPVRSPHSLATLGAGDQGPLMVEAQFRATGERAAFDVGPMRREDGATVSARDVAAVIAPNASGASGPEVLTTLLTNKSADCPKHVFSPLLAPKYYTPFYHKRLDAITTPLPLYSAEEASA